MNRLYSLLFKLIAMTLIALISFRFLGNNSILWIIVIGMSVTLTNLIIGDKVILPVFGNFTSSISNGLLGSILAYTIATFSDFSAEWQTLVLFFLLITLFEYYYHKYLFTSKKTPE